MHSKKPNFFYPAMVCEFKSTNIDIEDLLVSPFSLGQFRII